MSKQTTVDYLLQEFSEIIGRVNFTVTQDLFIRDAVIKAKEMEKEQIKDAHLIGLITSMEMEATKQSEQYYNETFKNS